MPVLCMDTSFANCASTLAYHDCWPTRLCLHGGSIHDERYVSLWTIGFERWAGAGKNLLTQEPFRSTRAALPADLVRSRTTTVGDSVALGYTAQMTRTNSLRVASKDDQRLVLRSLRSRTFASGALCVIAAVAALWMFPVSRLLATCAGLAAVIAALSASRDRVLTFDRNAGVMTEVNTFAGFTRKNIVPLFHFRAVVVTVSRDEDFMVYLDKRQGGAIEIASHRRKQPLLSLAKQIAAVADIRFVVDKSAA
jgi:hypothetical protein